MISTVLCGRFYNIFVSPMLHKKPSQVRLRGFYRKSLSVMAQTQESDQTFSAVSTMSMMV